MRPAFVGAPDGPALSALAELRARIAMLDRAAVVVWVNSSWSRFRQNQTGDTFAAVAVGVNYLAVCQRSRHPAASVIAEGVRAVIDGAVGFFELEYESLGAQGRRTKISVTPAPAGREGAVLMQVDSYGPTEATRTAGSKSDPAAPSLPAELLTGRERDVLALMARGLDNQAIAGELRIRYATVRGHVRSLMAKLGARSRLEAVVRAVQLGLVRVPRPTSAGGIDTAGE
jgi:DNA-binding NarL/FixJ family response regulator